MLADPDRRSINSDVADARAVAKPPQLDREDRTFASILGVCRVDARRADALLGHTDPRMTLGVYAQLLKLGHGNVAALEQARGCTRDQARELRIRASGRAPIPNQFRTRRETPSTPGPATGRTTRKALLLRGFNHADEGTRTLDFLHGKDVTGRERHPVHETQEGSSEHVAEPHAVRPTRRRARPPALGKLLRHGRRWRWRWRARPASPLAAPFRRNEQSREVAVKR
jgi:hypothetical protein